MSFAQVPVAIDIINTSLIGYFGVSLTEFDTANLDLIAAGSCIEIAGAFFKATTDITPDSASWTAISTNARAYLLLTPSGSVGSQTLAASWSSSIPVWSVSKQGWYTTTGSAVRVVASVIKLSSTTSGTKYLMERQTSIKGVVEVLTSGTTWVVPAGIHRIKVTTIGGGGGGGNSGSTGAASGGGGGGGGGGGQWVRSFVTVIPGNTITYAIGAGGAFGGGSGGTSSLTGASSALGGSPGAASPGGSTQGAVGGDGGGAGEGGGAGGPGTPGGSSGGGGVQGGNGGPGGAAGSVGQIYGGGGGGAGGPGGGGSGGSASGGNGASGAIIIEY